LPINAARCFIGQNCSGDQLTMDSFWKNRKAVLLVGGLGTRLRPVVAAKPKALAPVGDRPFLDLLIRQLRHQDIRHLVLCTGYLAQEIESELGDGRGLDLTLEYSRELRPMGTAGAVKLAEPHLRDVSDFLVLNGDSFMEIDFRELTEFHCRRGALASMAVVRMKNDKRYGAVRLAADGSVIDFTEKCHAEPEGLVNAGIYVFNHRIFDYLPDGPASLERDVFPKLIGQGLYASEQQGAFIDIGTPDDYARAQSLCDRLYEAASRKQSLAQGDK
jgi:NDP-sugar pyrophosphorylase family protein